MKKLYIIISFAALALSCAKAEQTEPEEADAATVIHPYFSTTMKDLHSMTDALPSSIQNTIRGNGREFLEKLIPLLSYPEDILVLVDKEHPLPSDYEPEDLVNLVDRGFTCNREGLLLREICIPDLKEMNDAAGEEGLTLLISSAYRSYDYQDRVFRYHVNTIGEEQAKRESAEPGKSQHQLGTTIDFGSITPEFAYTPEGKWLKEHAWEFGFSLSYPEGAEELTGYIHEIWHYRWIGKKAAAFERRFFNGMQQYMLTFLHDNRDSLSASFAAGVSS